MLSMHRICMVLAKPKQKDINRASINGSHFQEGFATAANLLRLSKSRQHNMFNSTCSRANTAQYVWPFDADQCNHRSTLPSMQDHYLVSKPQ